MRFPFRHQLEASDCGPACIQMVAAYYGKEISLIKLKSYCHITRLGVSLKDIIDGCRHIGLNAVGVHIDNDKIREMPLPAILYWKQEHYVVLYRILSKRGKRIYYIADPDFGKIQLEESSFLDTWTSNGQNGIGVVIKPENTFFDLPQENKTTIIQRFFSSLSSFRYVTEQKKKILSIFLFSILTFCCGLLIPFFLQKVFDKGIDSENMNLVLLLLLGQFSLSIGNQLGTLANNYILYKLGTQVGLNISTQYIHKLVRLPLYLFDTKLGTDLLQRLNDEEKIRAFLTITISSLLFIILNLSIYSCVLIYYNVYIFLIFFSFGIISVILSKIILAIRKRINYALFEGFSKKKNIENELVYGMIDIKMNEAHNSFLNQWTKQQETINNLLLKSFKYESGITGGTSFLNTFRDILVTGSCAYFVIQGKMTIGVMMTITYILGQLSSAINQMMSYSKTYQDSTLAYERMKDILQTEDENNKYESREKEERDDLELEDISFKYEGSSNPYVLKNITTSIPLNKVTAIVGASGSGKTTLLKLLLAFYYPQKGDLSIEGKSIMSLNINDWRKRCGVVMQDGFIFSGTIASNIALSDNNPNMELVEFAAKIACIDDFILHLPMKYHTKIGKTGVDLSGGQKQRILIARAVYKNPEFIFFDEATSSLDASNEKAIVENLKSFYRNKTVVIIAHRLSTVKNADHIIVLDKGEIAEQGIHSVLISNKGKYYELVKNQLELGI